MKFVAKEFFWGRFMYFTGVTDAPECLCKEPAVLIVGSGKKGGLWSAWQCAKEGSVDYKLACGYNQWIEFSFIGSPQKAA
jgi:hypothetical protein